MNKQSTTKKSFRELLNSWYGVQTGESRQHWNTQSGAKTRAYGDWLYSADKGMFDENYRLWIEAGYPTSQREYEDHC